MKRLLVKGNKYTLKVKITWLFAAKYVNLIVKKSVQANYFREAK